MTNSIYTIIFVFISVRNSLQELEQCPDLPAPIKFYRGQPGDLNFKELSDMFQKIFGQLGPMFQHSQSNVTFVVPQWNFTDMFSGMNFTFNDTDFSLDSAASAVDSSDKIIVSNTTVAPLSDSTTSAATTRSAAAAFNLGKFLQNLLPEEVFSGNASSGAGVGKLLKNPIGGSPSNIFPPHIGGRGVPIGTSVNFQANLNETQPKRTWGITIPFNAYRLEIAGLNESGVTHTFRMDADELKTNKSRKEYKKFAQHVDLSDFEIVPNTYYVVCVRMRISEKDQLFECQRCALLKPCDSSDCQDIAAQKIVSFQAPNSRVHPNEARLHFFVLDPPFSNLSLVTRVQQKRFDTRCPAVKNPLNGSDKEETGSEKFETIDRLFPDTVLYVTVPNLSPKEAYTVDGDLLINFGPYDSPNNENSSTINDKNGDAPFDWNKRLLIKNYFGGIAQNEYIIGKCNKPM